LRSLGLNNSNNYIVNSDWSTPAIEAVPRSTESNVGPLSTRVFTSLDDKFKVCGLRRRIWDFFLFLGYLPAIGCTVVFLQCVTGDDQDDESEVFPDSTSPTGNPRLIALQAALFPMIVHADAVEQPDPFADPTFPGSMAWNWTMLDPVILSSTTPMERYSLAVLYYATNGPTWNRNEFGNL
jgi:hypothetical protein